MTLERIEATAPSHWAAYLVNGDGSGLEGPEIALAEAFRDRALYGLPVVSCEDAGWLWAHDATPLGVGGADCQTYLALGEIPHD